VPSRMTDTRPAKLEDAASIATLSTQLGYPSTTEQAGSRLNDLLVNPDHFVVVAVVDGQVSGWAHVERRINLETVERAELMGLVVDAQARRAGIGRALVETAERWAAARHLGVMTVRSNVVRDGSHAFYRQLGYQAVKTQHVYQKDLRDDAHRA